MDDVKQWYVIHTYSGYENKVKTDLEHRVKTMDKEDKIFRILVPVEEQSEYKDGKKKITKKKIFPGYVLVEKPIPLLEEEAAVILRQMGVEDNTRPRIDYEPGETVMVVSGPFKDFAGVVREISPERGKLKVLVSMFGRETPVELDYGQVEKY